MLENYIKIAWRNVIKHRFYSLLNTAGLFTGITFTLLIGVYVWQELQVNRKLSNAKQQYILTTISTDPNIGYELATFGPMAKRLKEEYPHLVANYYRWDGITSGISKGDKHFREGLQVGDSTLLKMYGFELLYGNAATALLDPYSIVVTETKATKYFGRKDVVGETLTVQSFSGGKHDFKITGVLKELSENSVTHLAKDYPNSFFIPTNTLSFFGRQDLDSWDNLFVASYIQLKEGFTEKDLEAPIRQLMQQNADEILKKVITVKPVLLTDYYLQKDNHLVQRMLYTLSFTGLFILLMAIVNFINIAVSRSSTRMREIGVRKVLGGTQRQLIFQFLTESLILVSVATVLALGGYKLCKPVFAEVVGKELPALSSLPGYFLLVPVAFIVVTGLAAGLYPAFFLSSLKSVDSLKSKLGTVKENILLRKSLIGFQFTLAIVALVAAFVVTKQVGYFFSQRLGYDKEYMVTAQAPRDWTTEGVKKMLTVRNEFSSLPQVSSVSLSFEIPDGNNGGQVPVYKFGADSATASFAQLLRTDENYLTAYGIPLKAGAFFENSGQDSGKVVLNQKAIALLGFKNSDEAIGRQIRVPGDPTVFTIKGVTPDFAFGSMQQAIPPIVFFHVRFSPLYRYLSFKIKPGDVAASIEAIQKKWTQLLPGSSFEYSFMDDTLKKLYATELQLKKAAFTATLLSFIIVLLGVFSLISLSINKRVKEIGIRKVLGAPASGIVMLFVKEFMLIVSVAAVVACPVAYLIMTNWLNGYAYRIHLNFLPFILVSLMLALLVAVLIIITTMRTAIANSVKSLRTE